MKLANSKTNHAKKTTSSLHYFFPTIPINLKSSTQFSDWKHYLSFLKIFHLINANPLSTPFTSKPILVSLISMPNKNSKNWLNLRSCLQITQNQSFWLSLQCVCGRKWVCLMNLMIFR